MIFLDSSYLIALADEGDQFHNMAVELLPRLKGAKASSELSLSESVTGIAARLGAKAGMKAFENLMYDASTRVFFANKRLFERALPIFLRYSGRLSFADSVSVRLMYDQKIREIASFDSDFDNVENIVRLG